MGFGIEGKTAKVLGVIVLIGVVFLILLGTVTAKKDINSKREDAPRLTKLPLREAMYYEKLDDLKVRCRLCFRECLIPERQRGFCRNRENRGGILYALSYGLPCAVQVDPIEKEPMFHMLPGSSILCTGTASCNFRCKFCHNWHMSHRSLEETVNFNLPPEAIVNLAIRYGCKSLSFTYNEPTVFYEYMLDIVRMGKKKGLRTLFHTNGSLNPQPLKELLGYMDGVTVDLKSFDPKFYIDLSSSRLEPVLRSLRVIKEEGKWLEIVNLVIPTLNDDLEKMRQMCIWIKDNLGEDVPLHFTRFSPAHKLKSLPPTPIETLEEARKIALDVGLKYVYIGNVPGHEGNSTYCPRCKKRLIHRIHFSVLENNIEKGRCKFCDYQIPGIW